MYDYRKAIKSDISDYIRNEINFLDFSDLEELRETLEDELWTVDSVTSNASGSYTFNSWQACEYVTDNLDLYNEACDDLGVSSDEVGRLFLDGNFEAMDVSIRCHLLPECLADALAEIEDDFTAAHEQTESEEDYV